MTAGSTVYFVNDPPLVHFLASAKRCAGKGPYIFDALGHVKSYNELLADILRLRDMMRERLPPSAFDQRGLFHEDAPHVCITAKAGYEFLVAFFAVISLGGSVIPRSPEALPEEMVYFIDTPKASCLLTGKKWIGKAEKAAALTKEQKNHDVVPLAIPTDSEPLEEINIEIDEALVLSPSMPMTVIFTSGTTGAPKGVVLPRGLLNMPVEIVLDGADSVCLRPPQWLGGLISLVLPIMYGSKMHVPTERATAKELWDVFLNNKKTVFTNFSPSALRLMKEHVMTLSSAEQERHFACMKSLKWLMGGGSLPPPAMVDFWVNNTGMPFLNYYSLTELGGYTIPKMYRKGTDVTNSIGRPQPGIKLKLTEGDKGELLIWTPALMSHYLNDEEKTKAAFDEEGYFRTGDNVEVKDGEYFFLGRSSTDYVHFLNFFIPTVKVEVALSSLPYVADVCVVGVQDHEVKQICAAVICLTPEAQAKQAKQANEESDRITLQRISKDLHPLLPLYMHPRLLRLIDSMDELPLTSSQKPIKSLVVKQCFGANGFWNLEEPMPGVEYSGNGLAYVEEETKPWDWNGNQY